MDIIVHVTDFKSLTQSELIMQNLFATVTIGSTSHTGRGVVVRDAQFRSSTVENPLVLMLKNSRTETVMYVRNIPISTVLERGGCLQQWVAVYPPGDPQNLHFDVAAVPKEGCPQVCISVAIKEDLSLTATGPRPSLGYDYAPQPRGSAGDRADFMLPRPSDLSRDAMLPRASDVVRDSLMPRGSLGVDGTVREKELQAQRIKEHVAEMASAQRRAQDVGRLLQDNLRILEDMKRQLKGLEMQIAEQRVATQLLERDYEQLVIEESQLQDQIRQRDITFQELRDNRDEIDRELNRVLSEGEKQKQAMEMSSRDFSRQTQTMVEDIDQSKRLVSQLQASLQTKEMMLREREQVLKERDAERTAREASDREALRSQLDQTRAAVATARLGLEELQRRRRDAELEREAARAALAGAEGEARSLAGAAQAAASGAPLSADARAELELKREKLQVHDQRVKALEAELQSNRGRLEQLSGRIAELRTEAHDKELAAKRYEDEQLELQKRLAAHQDGAAVASDQNAAKEREVQAAERELDESRAALRALEAASAGQGAEAEGGEAAELERAVAAKRDELSATRQGVEELQRSCEALEAQVGGRREELQSRSAAFQQAQARVAELTGQLSKASGDIAHIDGAIRELEETACARAAGLEEARRQLQERAEGLAAAREETARAAEADKAREDELSKTTVAAREELSRLQARRQQSEARRGELEASLTSCRGGHDELQASIESLRAANARSAEQLSSLQEQRKAALAELARSREDAERLEAAASASRADLESTQGRISSRMTEIAALEAAYKEEVERMEADAAALDAQHQAVQQECLELADQLALARGEHAEAAQQVAAGQRRRDELDSELNQALAERVGLLKQGEDTLSVTNQQVQQAMDKVHQGAERNAEVSGRVSQAKARLSSTLGRLESIREEAEAEASRLQEAQAQLQAKQQDLESLRRQRGEQESELKALQLEAEALEPEVAAAAAGAEAERAAAAEFGQLEGRQARLLEEQRTADGAFQEALAERERRAGEAAGRLQGAASEALQKKDDEIRQQLAQIQDLEGERESLLKQLSGLDAERQALEDRLQERERARQGAAANAERKAQECSELESTIRQSRAAVEALERQGRAAEAELGELRRREEALRREASTITEEIQRLRGEMDRANSDVDQRVAAETARCAELQAQCEAERQEAEAQRRRAAELQAQAQAAQAECKRMGDEEERLQALLDQANKELRVNGGGTTDDKVLHQENPQDTSLACDDAAVARESVQEYEASLRRLSERLLEAQEAVRRRRAEEEEMRADVQRLREEIRATSDKMVHQVEHSNLQFETVQKLEEQRGRLESEVEILTLGLHDAEQRNEYLQKENALMQQQVEGQFQGSLQDWAAEVQRVKVEAEVASFREEIERWKGRAEQLRREKQAELSGMQKQHDESLARLRERIAATQAEIERCEQAAARREAALAKQREHGEAASPSAAMPGLVVPQRRLPQGHERRKALLVGINYAASHAPLKGCINDLWNLQCLLRHTLQYGDEQLRLLIDNVEGKPQRPERAPTKANIQAGLQWLVSDAQPGDNLLFIFCGYGAQHPTAPGSDQHEGYLVPVDFAADLPADFFAGGERRSPPGCPGYRLVSMAELSYSISQLPAMCRMSVMMDCCYTCIPHVSAPETGKRTFPRVSRGQVDYSKLRDFISRPRFLELPILPVQHTPPQFLLVGPPKCWLHCFLGSKLEEWAAEFPIEGTVQGVFSWAFLKALARGHFHCGLYQFQGMLLEMLTDLKTHFRGVEQTPVLRLSEAASMQDVVLWT